MTPLSKHVFLYALPSLLAAACGSSDEDPLFNLNPETTTSPAATPGDAGAPNARTPFAPGLQDSGATLPHASVDAGSKMPLRDAGPQLANPTSWGPGFYGAELLARDIQTFSVTSGFACAVTTDGRVLCRGSNYAGNLGNGEIGTKNGAPASRDEFSAVLGVANARDVICESSEEFCCALTADGQVPCWGKVAPIVGLPDDDVVPLAMPLVGLPESAVAIASTSISSLCITLQSGATLCADEGHLTYVDGLVETTALAGRFAIAAKGQAYLLSSSFGSGSRRLFAAKPLEGVTGASSFPTSFWQTGYLIGLDGTVTCWENCPLGGGVLKDPPSPTRIPGLTDVFTGNEQCVLQKSGDVRCWGAGGGGDFTTPTLIGNIPSAKRIGRDWVLLADGTLWKTYWRYPAAAP